MLYVSAARLENQNSCFLWYGNPAVQRNRETKFGNNYGIHRYHRALKIHGIVWNFYSGKKIVILFLILLSIQLSAWILNLKLCKSWLCTLHLKNHFSDSEDGFAPPSCTAFVAQLPFSLSMWDNWHRADKSLNT